MKKLFFLGLIAGAAGAVESVQLDMKLNMNGVQSQPAVIAKMGQAASIKVSDDRGEGYEISVLPEKSGSQDLAISLQIVQLKDGRRDLLSSPQVLTKIGQAARIDVQSVEHPKQGYSLEILPKLVEGRK